MLPLQTGLLSITYQPSLALQFTVQVAGVVGVGVGAKVEVGVGVAVLVGVGEDVGVLVGRGVAVGPQMQVELPGQAALRHR